MDLRIIFLIDVCNYFWEKKMKDKNINKIICGFWFGIFDVYIRGIMYFDFCILIFFCYCKGLLINVYNYD